MIVIAEAACGEPEDELLHDGFGSNEKEISHGRVPWQTHCGCLALGTLASLVG